MGIDARHLISSLSMSVFAGCLASCGGSSGPGTVAVSGSISGLSSDGLVLSSGSESLALHPGDSHFAFTTPVETGTSYSVVIRSQPTSRDQFCSVLGGTGTASTVTISCHATQWATSTMAGTGAYGSQDGPGQTASFTPLFGVAVDAIGNVFVADTANHTIRRVDPAGDVSTFAGSGAAGASDGAGTAASFNMPWRVSIAPDGTVYVTDDYNQKIRKISTRGDVTTLTGSGSIGSADGPAGVASFYYPFGLAAGSDGRVYVADSGNLAIRSVAPDGSVSTLAGSGVAGYADGPGPVARFQSPYGIAVDTNGYLYVADTNSHRIRKISPGGVVTTLAGDGTRGNADGPASVASFNSPQGIAVDANGNVYVADTFNHSIRKISAGVVSTLAGTPAVGGYADGTGQSARFDFPFDVAVDRNGTLYIADWGNLRVRRISAQ